MKHSDPSTQAQTVFLRSIAFPIGTVREGLVESLCPEVRRASPGFFFDRVIPVNLRDLPPKSRLRELSALKARLWEKYIEHLRTPDGSAEIRRWIEWLNQRQQRAVEDLEQRGWRARSYVLQLTHRMVIGLGRASVWETGMTWHRPTGLPYIPASAIKGVVRGWRITQVLTRRVEMGLQESPTERRIDMLSQLDDSIARQTENLPPKIRQDLQGVFRWFGSTETRGLVTFLDAFPTKPPTFELDVMNVHYPKYYRGDASQALDIENPNPVVFLTVARTPFCFWVLTDAFWTGKEEADTILDEVGKALVQALQGSGIGGKTRLGYGRFKSDS